MYEDAVNYMRTEEALINTIESEILKMPDMAARIEFNTSEFIGAEDLLSELRKKIPQKNEVVNTRKLAESAGITDCDIDMNMDISYVPIDEKIKLVTAESGVYEAQLKIDTASLMLIQWTSGYISSLRRLMERKFFEKADDDELLNYLDEHKFKTISEYSSLANRIIDTAKEKLQLHSAPKDYGAVTK